VGNKELLTEILQIPFSPSQMKKIKKLSANSILTPAAFVRQHLVITLKLKDDSK